MVDILPYQANTIRLCMHSPNDISLPPLLFLLSFKNKSPATQSQAKPSHPVQHLSSFKRIAAREKKWRGWPLWDQQGFLSLPNPNLLLSITGPTTSPWTRTRVPGIGFPLPPLKPNRFVCYVDWLVFWIVIIIVINWFI